MAKNSGIKLNLPSADDLFSTQEERDEESRESIQDIPIEEITDLFPHKIWIFLANSNNIMQNLFSCIQRITYVDPI